MKATLLAPLLASPLVVCGLAAIYHTFPTTRPALPEIPNLSLVAKRIETALLNVPMYLPQKAHDAAFVHRATTIIEKRLPSRTSFEVLALIRAAARRHHISEAFLKSIVAAESNFDTNAVSPKGAIGLMQLMPATAHEYGADPAIPEQNIEAGTRYLRGLMDKYRRSRNSLTRVIAAYNAGPGAVARYRGVPPFRETRRYVVRVRAFLLRFQNQRG
jgi:soluble lytic murein transglycosylase-like protein